MNRALITGASRGLGRTLATFLANQGYTLTLTGRGEAALEEVRDELSQRAQVTALAGDISEREHRLALRRATSGGLDLLINNASDLGTTPLPALVDYDLKRLRSIFETNVIAPLALIQELLPALKERGGLVINLSSDAALGGYRGWGGYGASKAALDLISKTLGAELRDVAVVSVDPGEMRTQMHQEAFPGEDISDRPLPEVTLPFWAWLLGQPRTGLSGRRFRAQADTWEMEGAL